MTAARGPHRFDRAEARAESLTYWATVRDRQEATRKAREAFLARFADKADPAHQLDPSARQEAAQRLLRAHMIRMAAARELKRRPK